MLFKIKTSLLVVVAVHVVSVGALAQCAGASAGTNGGLTGQTVDVGDSRVAIAGSMTAAIHSLDQFSSAPVVTLTPGDGELHTAFGADVAMRGDEECVVGAPKHDGCSPFGAGCVISTDAGTVHCFDLTTSSPQETVISPPVLWWEGRFGTSVEIEEDLMIVGSPGADGQRGRAYLYKKIGGSWVLQTTLQASDAQPNNRFGQSVDIDAFGNIIVGAPGTGAYIFFHDEQGNYYEHTKLTRPIGYSGGFGHSVAIDAFKAVVGSPEYNAGSAHMYTLLWFPPFISSWSYETALEPQENVWGRTYGWSVALEFDAAVVGGWVQDVSFTVEPMKAFVFRGENGWATPQKIDEGSSNRYGIGLDLKAGNLVVGNPSFNFAATAHLYQLAVSRILTLGTEGTNGMPFLVPDRAPHIGATVDLVLTNSLGAPTSGLIVLGHQVQAGTNPEILTPSFSVPIAMGVEEGRLTVPIPSDCGLYGVSALFQGIVNDPGAAGGQAYTPILLVTLGL